MSANNYTRCPQCVAKEKERQNVAMRLAADSYGKVTAQAYLDYTEDAKPRKVEESLAEYYEIGVHGDMFSVNYSSGCRACGFEVAFKHGAKVFPVPEKKATVQL